MKLPGVSKRAVAVIRKVLQDMPDGNPEDWLPCVVWLDDSCDEMEVIPGPALGLDYKSKSKMPKEYIVQAHGLAIAFDLPREIEEKVKDSILDFVHGNFIFVDPSISTWLDK